MTSLFLDSPVVRPSVVVVDIEFPHIGTQRFFRDATPNTFGLDLDALGQVGASALESLADEVEVVGVLLAGVGQCPPALRNRVELLESGRLGHE